MTLKAAIFDLDGVVVDTVPLHFKAWKRMFEEHGKPFTFEDYKSKVDGIPRMDGARAILTDLSDEDMERAATQKQEYFLEALRFEPIPTFESTVLLIANLRAAGVKRAVISSSRNCPAILQQIGLFDELDTVICGSDITKGKPDPQIFLMAAEQLGVDPADCVVFEDAVLGVEAAKNAKMHCIGIDRYDHPERLADADLVVKDLSEVDVDRIRSLF